jgi:hypothetical protein
MGSPNVPSETSCRAAARLKDFASARALASRFSDLSASLRMSGAFFGAASKTPMSCSAVSSENSAPMGSITWFAKCLTCAGDTRPQFLKWRSLAIKAVEKIYRAIVPSLTAPPDGGSGALLPILNAYNPEGATRNVDFNTSKATLFQTRADKCHLNYVVYDQDWEAGLAERLEQMPEVLDP